MRITTSSPNSAPALPRPDESRTAGPRARPQPNAGQPHGTGDTGPGRATLDHGRCEQRSSTAVSVGQVSAQTVLQQYQVGLSRGTDRAMKGTQLTERQHEVLQKIREYVNRCGVPPSRTELAQSVGLTFATAVKTHLEALERKGWIELKPGMDRGIVLLREGMPVFDPDTLPTVPAGTPALADETAASFRVPETLSRRIHPQADFYLIVQGDSMDRVGYTSNDIVAVKRNPEPNEGDVVIARLGHEITLKCFHRAGRDRIELQPRSSNPEHRPIVIDGTTADWEIVGVVVGAMIGARPTTGC